MSMTIVLQVLEIVAYILLGGLTIWYRTNAKLNKEVNGLIDRAEAEYIGFKQGNKKFQAVTDWLYEMIPAGLKMFFPKSFIEELVQNAFEQSSAYAKKQLDKIAEKTIKK